MVDKVVSLEEAVAVIADSDTICVSGFVGIGTPEALLRGLAERYDKQAEPKDISLLFAAAPGDGKDRGLNRLSAPGLVKRAIGGHWSLVPKLGQLAVANKISAYNLPLGCISQLYRDIAAGKPGMFSKVGLNTFVDPRQIGGAINESSTEKLVELMELDGEEWLFYRSIPIDVAFIRGTTADKTGNITMEREALTLDMLSIAQAAKNSGGLVIAQVERICAEGSMNPREVVVPGNLVDCVVVADPSEHLQTYDTPYNHAFTGRLRGVVDELAPMPFSDRKIIARRAAMELPINGVVNLGIGMPEGVGAVANEEEILDHITLTTEAGVMGGVPQSGLDFGAAVNANAITQTNQMFDFYDGGGLDLAVLGMAEVDQHGNVNVSRFKDRFAGAGGFINISQNARKLVFVGTFTARGLRVDCKDRELSITSEGQMPKFIEQVEQITFNGKYAAQLGQQVLYVTERCVFRMTVDGLELAEVAPGIDIERDILAHMAFKPIVNNPKIMDPEIFDERRMKLKNTLINVRMEDRLTYDASTNTVFINLAGTAINTREDLDEHYTVMHKFFGDLGKKVNIISNFDGRTIAPKLRAAYADFQAELEKKYFLDAARYTTSAFLRQKMGQDLKARALSPNIFETAAEAAAFINAQNKG
ncbi:acyl CoA:acetate/3-ketoacid CoA transferase [Amylibacter kogurei]|uniref:Acyl CoA:acetate/3-ketoacid CoA transferase n=1 Tax=Paramylibacter kogurei TaxID=1889778 RepID=A0A2G5K1X6_9RHOB|nr:acyl CoA:acetate/3-ketoacid CoA transferase [Amylibacter kogurei]PIB23538.1 acyl CoA:acetate/3-ketoacid CoA transferase [Amylibacter kogurei]